MLLFETQIDKTIFLFIVISDGLDGAIVFTRRPASDTDGVIIKFWGRGLTTEWQVAMYVRSSATALWESFWSSEPWQESEVLEILYLYLKVIQNGKILNRFEDFNRILKTKLRFMGCDFASQRAKLDHCALAPAGPHWKLLLRSKRERGERRSRRQQTSLTSPHYGCSLGPSLSLPGATLSLQTRTSSTYPPSQSDRVLTQCDC